MSKRTKKVNRMDDFEIDEISAVDQPAQAAALAVLMKSKSDPSFMKRMRLTSEAEGHQHLMELGAEAGTTSHDRSEDSEYGHSHAWVRNDDGSISIGMADGHTHTVIEKRFTAKQALAELSGEHNKPATSGGGQPTGDNPMTKTAEQIAEEKDRAVEKRIQDAESRAQRAEQLATLTDVQKSYFSALSSEDQSAFLGMTASDRNSAVTKAAGEDPVIYTTDSGVEIRKSAGVVVMDLAKRADQAERNLAIEKAARQRETFAKRAQTELSNLPGDESAQIALLKAVDGIPDQKDKDAVLAILKAANTGVAKAFETSGTSAGAAGGGADAESKLEKMANDHFTANGGSFEKSYKAVMQTPEGRSLYKQSLSA